MLTLIFNNIKRELKVNFAGSHLGLFWMLLTPLFQTLIFYYIFEYVLKSRFPKEVTANMPYSAYLIIGLAFWTGFVQGVSRGANALIDNRYFIKKLPIPSYVYVISSCTVGFMFTPIVLLYSVPILKLESIKVIIGLLPILVLWYIFCIGVSLTVASLSVYIRDLPHLIGPLLSFLFYTVPIVYPYSLIPESIRPLIGLNPLFHMVKSVYLLSSGEINPKVLTICLFISVVSALVGVYVYKKLEAGFTDVL